MSRIVRGPSWRANGFVADTRDNLVVVGHSPPGSIPIQWTPNSVPRG